MITIFGICDICGEYSNLVFDCYGEFICESCFAKKYPERWFELVKEREKRIKKEYYNYD